jgi:hypothetical protein
VDTHASKQGLKQEHSWMQEVPAFAKAVQFWLQESKELCCIRYAA